MGLFDFVKDAGAKIFGKEEKDPRPQVRTVDPKELEAMKRRKALEKLLAEFSLQVENLKIDVSGDTATVNGIVDDQAEREKVVLALGNVAGIARGRRPCSSRPRRRRPKRRCTPSLSGDTLSKIAKKYYGDANKYPVIFEANKPMLKDPDKIYPGQVLRIPPLAA